MPVNNINSLVERSAGMVVCNLLENPNIIFIQDLKKKVGPIRYKKTSKKTAASGNKSRKKEKKRISETKKIDPGNPKKTSIFKRVTKNSLGHRKFKPLISVINLVLNLLAIASTNKNEFVEISAWLINIAKLAKSRFDCPLMIQIVNQCISTTVE